MVKINSNQIKHYIENWQNVRKTVVSYNWVIRKVLSGEVLAAIEMTRSSHVRSEQREFYEKWTSSKRPWMRTSLICFKYRKRLVWINYGVGRVLGKDQRNGHMPDHGGFVNVD